MLKIVSETDMIVKNFQTPPLRLQYFSYPLIYISGSALYIRADPDIFHMTVSHLVSPENRGRAL